jgi:streptogramin lyase
VLLAGFVSGAAASTYTVNEFPLPAGVGFSTAGVDAVAGAGDSAIWFALANGHIGRIPIDATPGGGSEVTQYAIPSGHNADAITNGPDGNLWFTESGANTLGSVTNIGATSYPSNTVTEFTANGDWRAITTGPDNHLWAADNASTIDKIAPGDPPTVTPYATNTGPSNLSGPDGIATGGDGNLWFTSDTTGAGTWKATPAGVATEVIAANNPGGNGAGGIVAAPDGNVWLTEQQPLSGGGNANAIASVTPAGSATEYTIPTASSMPEDIAVGPDGALWFTESAADKIGRITTAGQISEIPLATGSHPWSITSAFGNVWFTETGTNKLGEIVVPASGGSLPFGSSGTSTIVGDNIVIGLTSPVTVPPTAHLAATPSTNGDTATFAITCDGTRVQYCTGTAGATTTEHLDANGHSITAITAKRHLHKRHLRTTLVNVGGTSFSIPTDSATNVTLPLNATGRRLLKHFKQLPALLTIKTTDGSTIATAHLTFRHATKRK